MGHKVKQSLVNSRVDFFYYAFRNVLLVSIPLLVVSGVVLSHLSSHSSATGSGSGTDSLTISISSACTLSSVVDIEHSTNTNVGTYTSDIGKTTIKTLCNDGNGYSVYAVGYSNNEEGNNKLINSEYPQYSIDTGLNTSGLTSAWAMKLNNIPDDPSPTPPTIESDYNNIYGIVPPYWTKVASRTSGTTDMDEGSSFTTTYAVYASSNQHAGTYLGQVKYVLTHPSTQPYVYYMQEVDKWKNNIAMEESVQAIDMRDGKKYWVTKLKDGNIWMTQNLDFDIDPTRPLTSEDTDLTDYSLTGAYADGYTYDANTGITTWTPERKIIDFQNTTVTGWVNDNSNPYSASKTDSTETGHASLGNYYNWTAAIASNNSSSLTNSVAKNSICPKGWKLPDSLNRDFGNLLATYSVIPSSASSGYMPNGLDIMISSPLYFIRPGWVGGSLTRVGYDGYYWSNTSNGNNAYVMGFSPDSVNPNNQYTRNDGFSIRCLAR